MKEINKEQLLVIAEKLFEEQGVEKTTMSSIAKEANISTRTMFRYFGTKEKLVIEVIRRGVKGMNSAMDKLILKEVYQCADGLTQICMISEMLINIVMKCSMGYVGVEEVETYLVRHKNRMLIDQYHQIYTRITNEADRARQKGLKDGTISDIYKEDEMFYTVCNNVRGFVYRIAVQLQFTDYNADEMERLKNNHLKLIEKLLLP